MYKIFTTVFMVSFLGGFSSTALAGHSNFSFTNRSDDYANLKIVEHNCLHHPERFNVTIPPVSSQDIVADWFDHCDTQRSLKICVEKSCVTLGNEKYFGYVIYKVKGKLQFFVDN